MFTNSFLKRGSVTGMLSCKFYWVPSPGKKKLDWRKRLVAKWLSAHWSISGMYSFWWYIEWSIMEVTAQKADGGSVYAAGQGSLHKCYRYLWEYLFILFLRPYWSEKKSRGFIAFVKWQKAWTMLCFTSTLISHSSFLESMVVRSAHLLS